MDFILLTYNQAAYVRGAVEAALAQTGPVLDILISDDASTDDTWSVVEDAVAGYDGPHRLRLNRNPRNLGITAHLNRCVAMTSGRYLIAAAGDDLSYPDRAQTVLDCFERTGAWLVHSKVDTIDETGAPAGIDFDVATFFHTVDPMAAAGSFGLYVGATGCWDRQIFEKYGPLPDSGVYEDLILGFRAAMEGRIARIDRPLVAYRWAVGVSQQHRFGNAVAWTAARRATLTREINTLDRRLDDAGTAGLGPADPLFRHLVELRARHGMRLDAQTHAALAYFRSHAGRPFRAADLFLEERRKRRRLA